MAGEGDFPFRSAWAQARARIYGRGLELRLPSVPGSARETGALEAWFFDLASAGGGLTLTVTAGVVAIAGQSVSLRVTRSLAVNPAPVTIAGQSVGLRRGFALTTQPATVATSGSAVDLRQALRVNATPATVAIAGQVVGLSRQGLLTVLPATVAIAGQSVTLTRSGTAGLTLSVLPATVAIVGLPVGLTRTEAAPRSFGSAFGEPLYGWPPRPAPKAIPTEKQNIFDEDRHSRRLVELQNKLVEAKSVVAVIGRKLRDDAADAERARQRVDATVAMRRTVRDLKVQFAIMSANVARIEQQIAAINAEHLRQEMDDEDLLLLAA